MLACCEKNTMNITSLALQLAPASVVLDKIATLPGWPSLAAQCELSRLLGTKHLHANPPPQAHWKYLMKCIEKDILAHIDAENGPNEDEMFCDELMELIVEAQTGQVDSEKSGHLSYKSISIPNLYIPIKVKQSHNQVGTKVWGAGVYLGELLQRVPHVLQRATVLELGAGVGITGLLIGRALSPELQPAKVVMTDFHFEVVDLLQHNIDINTDPHNPGHKCILEADMLDWGTVQHSDIIRYNAKILIVADCTYSESGNTLLVSAFKSFLSAMRSHTASTADQAYTASAANRADETYLRCLSDAGEPYILIACTVRHPTTYAHFRGLIDLDGELQVLDATEWAASCFPEETTYYYAEDRAQIALLCIHSA